MKRVSFAPSFVLMGLCCASAAAPRGWAAESPATKAAGSEAITVETHLSSQTTASTRDKYWLVPVKHVPPKLLAWWLDPANNENPLKSEARAETMSMKSEKNVAQKAEAKGVFELPANVRSVVPVDGQQGLIVLGTEEGRAKVEEILSFLDRPLRALEIEAKCVELSRQELEADGVNVELIGTLLGDKTSNNPDIKDPGPLGGIRFTAAQIERVNDLVNEQKARVLFAPRVTVINNRSTKFSAELEKLADIGVASKGGAFQALKSADGAAVDCSLVQTLDFDVTPTINNDDTVTFVMKIARSVKLKRDRANDVSVNVDLYDLGRIETIFNRHIVEPLVIRDTGPATSWAQFLGSEVATEAERNRDRVRLILINTRFLEPDEAKKLALLSDL